jgi:hypothetical protein
MERQSGIKIQPWITKPRSSPRLTALSSAMRILIMAVAQILPDCGRELLCQSPFKKAHLDG